MTISTTLGRGDVWRQARALAASTAARQTRGTRAEEKVGVVQRRTRWPVPTLMPRAGGRFAFTPGSGTPTSRTRGPRVRPGIDTRGQEASDPAVPVRGCVFDRPHRF